MTKKKKLQFPTAYTILFIVAALVAILTWIMPAGKYDSLAYSSNENVFIVTTATGEINNFPPTQETLDTLNIKAKLDKFVGGDIWKPIGIPGTYTKLDSNPQGIKDLFQSPINGMYEGVDIIFFILIIGGFIGVVNHTGAFDSGISHLAKVLNGKEKWLIIIITSLIALGGTTFGLAEETIAFYPILVPVFLAVGYDAMVAVAAIYVGSSIGTMASTVNPFATIMASNAAGINWTSGILGRGVMLVVGTTICIIYIIRYAEKVKKDPSKSLIFSQKDEIEKRFLHSHTDKEAKAFDIRTKLILSIFALSFIVMIYGVSKLDWWFLEMTTLFFVASIVVAIIEKIDEKIYVAEFLNGAKDLLGVAMIVGIARGVTMIMDNGLISDTMLYYTSNIVDGMGKGLFINVMMVLFAGLSFFVPSSSGLAVLSMPIMAPLADVVGIPREAIVSAYQYGMGMMAFITPTGLVLASLMMVNVTLDKWFKFIMPLLGILLVFTSGLLLVGVYF
jgi:uncharacterized ion transporter superfamily protein YfcC